MGTRGERGDRVKVGSVLSLTVYVHAERLASPSTEGRTKLTGVIQRLIQIGKHAEPRGDRVLRKLELGKATMVTSIG